ncbi:MAG: hypothetical protein EA385_14390 [Salinarimonadaceae bacterium]|nr:MAG: hypothetical protein EA385_14390 [Salinarimonadaceae bacterium]
MTVAYGPKGLIGLLTPQANTTVEPEMAVMTPPGFAVVNARLKSDKGTIVERLLDYFEHYLEAPSEFANAPLSVIGYACTGASYFAGPEREDSVIAAIEAARGVPAITAASAVVDALRALDARRIVLVSPYDGPISDASLAYWTARGFEIAAHVSAYKETAAFHPIYSMSLAEAGSGLDSVAGVGADAFVMLGTGMPTLPPIAERPFVDGAPVLSCMLCLGWRLIVAARGGTPDRESLRAFLLDQGWRSRLRSAMA